MTGNVCQIHDPLHNVRRWSIFQWDNNTQQLQYSQILHTEAQQPVLEHTYKPTSAEQQIQEFCQLPSSPTWKRLEYTMIPIPLTFRPVRNLGLLEWNHSVSRSDVGQGNQTCVHKFLDVSFRLQHLLLCRCMSSSAALVLVSSLPT